MLRPIASSVNGCAELLWVACCMLCAAQSVGRAYTAQRRAARVPTAQVGKQLKPQSEASMRNQRHTTDRHIQRKAAQLVDPDGSECSSATTLAAAKLFVAAVSTRR